MAALLNQYRLRASASLGRRLCLRVVALGSNAAASGHHIQGSRAFEAHLRTGRGSFERRLCVLGVHTHWAAFAARAVVQPTVWLGVWLRRANV